MIFNKEAKMWRENKYLEEPNNWCTLALKRMFKDELRNKIRYVVNHKI